MHPCIQMASTTLPWKLNQLLHGGPLLAAEFCVRMLNLSSALACSLHGLHDE